MVFRLRISLKKNYFNCLISKPYYVIVATLERLEKEIGECATWIYKTENCLCALKIVLVVSIPRYASVVFLSQLGADQRPRWNP